jgi:hypothetical protein
MRIQSAVALTSIAALLALAPASLAAASTPSARVAAGQVVRPADTYPIEAYVYSGAAYDSYNSSGEGFEVLGTTPGHYDVVLYGLGLATSQVIADVTSISDSATCAVDSISDEETNLFVIVSCYDFSGGPSSAAFNLLVTHPIAAPHGVFDYALMNSPGQSRTLTSREYNSAHKKNSVKHLGTGRYQVTFGGPKSSGTHGVVKVSPFGDAAGDCVAVGWHGTKAGEVASVDCYDTSAALVNREFTITYASASNLLAMPGVASANAYANRDSTKNYRPSVQYNYDRHARVTISRASAGMYEAFFAGSEGTYANGGDAQVTAVAGADRHCAVTDWQQGSKPNAKIICTTNSGVLTNTNFVVNWVVG